MVFSLFLTKASREASTYFFHYMRESNMYGYKTREPTKKPKKKTKKLHKKSSKRSLTEGLALNTSRESSR